LVQQGGPGQAVAPPSPLLIVPNVTAHPSTASVPTSYYSMSHCDEATQTHCYNPFALAYPIWTYYAHGRQRKCQEVPVSLPSGRLEKTTRSSPHHMAQHRPTGSETTPPYAPRSSRFGSEPPSVEDDVDVWRYAIVRVACQKKRRRTVIVSALLRINEIK